VSWTTKLAPGHTFAPADMKMWLLRIVPTPPTRGRHIICKASMQPSQAATLRQLKMLTFAAPTGGIRTVQHVLPQAGDVVLRDTLRKAQLLRDMQRDADLQCTHDSPLPCRAHKKASTCAMRNMVILCRGALYVSNIQGAPTAYLIHCQVGIRGDDGAAREVYTLSRQVATEAALLALQPLHKAPATRQQHYVTGLCGRDSHDYRTRHALGGSWHLRGLPCGWW
jgi:hypothetical protein